MENRAFWKFEWSVWKLLDCRILHQIYRRASGSPERPPNPLPYRTNPPLKISAYGPLHLLLHIYAIAFTCSNLHPGADFAYMQNLHICTAHVNGAYVFDDVRVEFVSAWSLQIYLDCINVSQFRNVIPFPSPFWRSRQKPFFMYFNVIILSITWFNGRAWLVEVQDVEDVNHSPWTQIENLTSTHDMHHRKQNSQINLCSFLSRIHTLKLFD